MNDCEHFSAEHLNAFIDGELDFDDSERLLEAMESDPLLCRRIERLRDVKLAVNRHARTPPANLPAAPAPASTRRGTWRYAVAAGLMLALGFGLGLQVPPDQAPPAAMTISIDEIGAAHGNLLMHVSDANSADFGGMLDRIEQVFAEAERKGVQIEVVANAGGLDMLRSDASPHAGRIRHMMSTYPELQFVACTNAIKRYQERGTVVHLIEDTVDETTAIERIVTRIGQGWTYVAI